jgi:hypothetical protein
LTTRDIEIFHALTRYRYLRSTYLHAFAGGSLKRFVERLGDLFHEGYLDRPEAQWDFADARISPVMYELGMGGQRALDGLGCKADEARTFLGSYAHRQFAHSTMICEALASIELATRSATGLRFVPWPEILAKAPEATQRQDAPFRLPSCPGAIVPDGLFGIEYRHEDGAKTYRFFALEADRGTMPVVRSGKGQTSLVGKLAAYGAFIGEGRHRSHLGVPNLLVLTVTTDQRRVQTTMNHVAGAASLLFKAIGPQQLTAPNPRLLCEPWERAAAASFLIDH